MRFSSCFVGARVEASGRQTIELPDLPVKRPGGNEATQGAYPTGRRAGRVPQLRLGVGRRRDNRLGDGGRIVAVRHCSRDYAVEDLPLLRIDRQRCVGLDGFRVEAGPGIGGLDKEHPNAVLPDLVGHRFGVTLDRVLGRGITAHVRRGDEPEHGRDVDDAATGLGAHLRQDGLRHTDEPEEVDVEDALVLSDGTFLGGTRCTGTCIVDQDVEPPKPLDHAPDHRAHRLVTGHVEVEERYPVALGDTRCLPARSDYLETGFDERDRSCLPDTRGRARYERFRVGPQWYLLALAGAPVLLLLAG